MSRSRAVLLVMCVGYFLVLLDVTIVNVALPEIGRGLGASVAGLQWVVDGYALALAALMLAGGTVGDLHGHKRVVICGLLVFGAGSAACAAAPSVPALVGARVVQGVGAALLLPGTLAIIGGAFPEAPGHGAGGLDQARAIGIWAGVGSLALPAGPLLGGALLEATSWRAIFWINVPIVLIAALAAQRLVTESREPAERPLDLAGVALGAGALLALTTAFIEDGSARAVAAVAAVAVGGAFLAVERRRGGQAMLPTELWRRRAFRTANGTAATMNLCTLGTLFVLTLYLQQVRGERPLTAGLQLLPLFAPLALVAPLAGRATSRTGPAKPMTAGLLIAAAGLASLAVADRGAGMVAALLAWGVGLGVMTPAIVAQAIAAVPKRRAGLASAINNTARQAGGAIGIAIAGAVAGSPAARDAFLHGFHAVALAAAALYVAAAALNVAARA